MSFFDLLFGRPLASSADHDERIGTLAGIPIFGLDALSSAAYGPEAALTLLIPLGAAGVSYIVPISASIIVLLMVVFLSYLQTIHTYPGGGGSYTVASQNLGVSAGLLAGAALMIDYVLVVAVGISAGVGALVSAIPRLEPQTLPLCLLILLIISVINLRGVREAGVVFMIPTYLFIVTLLAVIAIGIVRTLTSGGHPHPVVAPPRAPVATAAISAWLLLKAFSSGCTAMTGVEAVSNGVKAFHEPTARHARQTLTVIIGLLMVMLAGIAYLVRAYGIAATDPGKPGYESVLSMLIGAVAGKGVFYYLTIGSILLVLALSANTAFADFPRLCRVVAHDGFLPHLFTSLGRRLVYSHGVYALVGLSGLLLIVFGGVTDRLIPLFAIGAFLAFTLSQAGMVAHWKRTGGPAAVRNMVINGLGATVTGVTVLVVLVAKFIEGAWITLLLIPGLFILMASVRRHYHRVALQVACQSPLEVKELCAPLIVVPIDRWSRVAKQALTFALTMSPEIVAVHVDCGEEANFLRQQWSEYVEIPVSEMGKTPPKLEILRSPYRLIIGPIVNYVLELEGQNPCRQIAVLIPELVERRWYYHLLHNPRAAVLKALLYFKGSQRIVVVNVPWYVHHEEVEAPARELKRAF